MTSLYRSDDDARAEVTRPEEVRPEEIRAVLARLAAVGTPWLAVTARAGDAPPDTAAAVIDVCDLSGVPLTVDPFEPAPGSPVQAHIERLAALLEAAFRPPGPVRAAIRLALRRVYTEQGWDLAAGGALPGAAAPPGVPSFAGLCRAAIAAAADLGFDPAARAAVRAFLDVTLAPLWTGQAGRFLAGGHPADLAALFRGNMVFVTGDIAAEDSVTFLAGVLLLSLAGHVRGTGPHASRPAVVLGVPAGTLRPVLDVVRATGAEVILARPGDGHDRGYQPVPVQPVRDDPVRGGGSVLRGRRSVACGLQCRQRPCTGRELHDAELRAGSDGQVWLRLWAQVLVLAFVTGRPLPHVPQPLLQSPHQPPDARARECLLATVVDAAVRSRALALRYSYDPHRLIAAVAAVAAGQLATATQHPSAPQFAPVTQHPLATQLATATGHPSATQLATATQHPAAPQHPAAGRHHGTMVPARAGQFWVIPQLRWLHEAERLNPLAQHHPLPGDIAPPLDFGLAGLVDWPGISVGDRLAGLRRHRLSMEFERNRALATIALLGTEPDQGLAADLVIVGIGRDQPERLRYVSRMLGTAGHGGGAGWLEVVLSWPARLIAPTGEPDLCQAATG